MLSPHSISDNPAENPSNIDKFVYEGKLAKTFLKKQILVVIEAVLHNLSWSNATLLIMALEATSCSNSDPDLLITWIDFIIFFSLCLFVLLLLVFFSTCKKFCKKTCAEACHSLCTNQNQNELEASHSHSTGQEQSAVEATHLNKESQEQSVLKAPDSHRTSEEESEPVTSTHENVQAPLLARQNAVPISSTIKSTGSDGQSEENQTSRSVKKMIEDIDHKFVQFKDLFFPLLLAFVTEILSNTASSTLYSAIKDSINAVYEDQLFTFEFFLTILFTFVGVTLVRKFGKILKNMEAKLNESPSEGNLNDFYLSCKQVFGLLTKMIEYLLAKFLKSMIIDMISNMSGDYDVSSVGHLWIYTPLATLGVAIVLYFYKNFYCLVPKAELHAIINNVHVDEYLRNKVRDLITGAFKKTAGYLWFETAKMTAKKAFSVGKNDTTDILLLTWCGCSGVLILSCIMPGILVKIEKEAAKAESYVERHVLQFFKHDGLNSCHSESEFAETCLVILSSFVNVMFIAWGIAASSGLSYAILFSAVNNYYVLSKKEPCDYSQKNIQKLWLCFFALFFVSVFVLFCQKAYLKCKFKDEPKTEESETEK